MLTSYYTLAANAGELKWLTVLTGLPDSGITAGDLTEAELFARDKVNLWIVRVAGEIKGGAIVSEFLHASAQADIDPSIRYLAQLISSARILRLAEERNFINQGSGQSDQLRRKDWTEVQTQAIELAKDIERGKKTVKADGTVRSWGMGAGQQGPAVGGPMATGSLFDDKGFYKDVNGVTWVLPHVPPIEQAT